MSYVDPMLIERGPLLNFWHAPIQMGHPHADALVTYPTVEHRFQAMKSLCAREGAASKRATHDAVARAHSPYAAKQMGRAMSIDVARWDEIAGWTMQEAVFAKFDQHRDLRSLLIATCPHSLIEHRPDKIWGDGMDGSGMNLMGRILEIVRMFALCSS